MANSALWSEGASTFNETSVAPALPVKGPYTLQGMKRECIKLGSVIPKPASMNADEMFWGRVNDMAGVPNWPVDEYPLTLDGSSDHATDNGGVWFWVLKPSASSFTAPEEIIADPNAWFEWDEVSGESVFSHITKKTNPIFSHTTYTSTQTETPTRVVKDGVTYLYTHNSSVNNLQHSDSVQASFYATSSNGVDFGGIFPALTYDPVTVEGNGHAGYLDVGLNTFENIPYDYIGRATHGGGFDTAGPAQQIIATNDLTNFVRLHIWGRMRGELTQYNESGSESYIYIIESVHSAIKEGAYYRIRAAVRPNVVTGGVDEYTQPCELLVDENFNVVASPNIFIRLGNTGEFDELEIQNYAEFTFRGKTFGIYKGLNASGVSSYGFVETKTVPHTWELFRTHAEKTVLQSFTNDGTNAPSNLVYSEPPKVQSLQLNNHTGESVDIAYINCQLDGTESTAISDTGIVLADYDVIDLNFKKIGKEYRHPQFCQFGFIDQIDSPTSMLAYQWRPRTYTNDNARSEPMVIKTLGTSNDVEQNLSNYFGQSSRWRSNDQDESALAVHDIGVRIIPSENKLIILSGVSGQEVIDISGFDYTKPLKMFLRSYQVAGEPTEARGFGFEAAYIEAYSGDKIAVPNAPTVTTSKSTDSITLTTNNVSGATGYKYFLDNQQNETGTFTGLEPETTYTVYARATNALGDSAPSTIQTVTTDEAIPVNQPPVADAGPDQSVEAGVEFILDGTGSQDTDGTIVEWRWTQTAGDPVILNTSTPSQPKATSPSRTSAQTLTFQLITVDDEGVESAPGTVNVNVAAVVLSEILKVIERLDFDLATQGDVNAYFGRANREVMKLKPSDPTGLALDADGFMMLDSNTIEEVKVIAEGSSISSKTDSIILDGSEMLVRLGDLEASKNGNIYFSIVVFVEGDTKGVVVSSKGSSGNKPMSYVTL